MDSGSEQHRSAFPAALLQRGVLAVSAVSALLLLLDFAWPMLMGKTYVHSDLGAFHLPMRHFYAESVRHGWSAIWCPYEFTGFYLQGEGQAVLSHPLNMLQYRLLPFVHAFNLELLRNYIFLLLGTYLFLRRWRIGREGALLGGLLFSFSSFNVAHFMHMNFVAIVAHIPWLLLAQDIALRSPSRRNTSLAWISVSLLTASQLLHSHPQVTWMSLVVEGLYALFVLAPALTRHSGPRVQREAFGRLFALGLALALGFVTAAVQLLPMWESLQDSFRNDPREIFLEILSLTPIGVIQLLAPYLPGEEGRPVLMEFALYCGSVAPVLVAWILLRRRAMGRSWELARAALVLAMIGLLLAMGDSGLLHRLERALPLVGLFRAPVRHILLIELGICVAAGVAFSDLVRVSRGRIAAPRRIWPLALLPLLGILIAVAVVGTDFVLKAIPVRHVRPELIILGALLTALATLLVVAAARGRRSACAALVVLAAADLAGYAGWLRDPEPVKIDKWLESMSVPSHAPGTRVDSKQWPLMMNGVRFASGYVAMIPDRELPLDPRARGRAPPSTYRKALQVSSVSRGSRRRSGSPLPRARLVASARESRQVLDDMKALDVARVALVSERVELEEAPPGRALIVHEQPGEIRVETGAVSRQLLVLAESYHAGWRASIDGERCTIVRVYGDYMGCVVPPGDHTVVFVFDPASYRWGKNISWLGLALTAFAPAYFVFRGGRWSGQEDEGS